MNFPHITSIILSSVYFYVVLISILMFIANYIAPVKALLDKISLKPSIPPDEQIKPENTKTATIGRVTYKKIILFVLLSRLIMYIFSYIVAVSTNYRNGSFSSVLNSLFTNWDAKHYLNIAMNGYKTVGDDRFLIVFYPFYPLLIKLLGVILGGSYLLAAVLLSLTAYCLSSIILYQIMCRYFDKEVAMRSVILMGLFPPAFFFAAPFTESIFLFLSIMTFSHAKKREFVIAGIYGALAAFTRNFGILLIIPIFIEAISEKIKKEELLKAITGTFLPITGIISYLAINFSITGNMFTFLKYQKEHWNQQFTFFPKVIEYIASYSMGNDFAYVSSLWRPQLIIIALTIIIMALGIRCLTPSLALYSVFYMLFVMSPSWLLSSPRYILPLFPLYIILACKFKNKFTFYSIAVILTVMQLLYCCMYARGWYVM